MGGRSEAVKVSQDEDSAVGSANNGYRQFFVWREGLPEM